jgi:hypothetical protein
LNLFEKHHTSLVVVLGSKADIWLECGKYNPDIRPILVWPVLLAQVLPTSSTDFSLPKPGFFQWQKSLKNQYLHILNPNLTPKHSIKSCSSRSFQQHQRHIAIPPKFSATIQFNFQ